MRTNDDQWSITDSVGRTALLVALGRALETRSDAALISDPYAAEFVADSGETDLAPERIEALVAADDRADLTRAVDLLRTMMAARTKRIDAALTEANAQGCAQVVILASGLDARAYRLQWRPDTTVFEVDQPEVLAFKEQTLARLDAQATATRVAVARDLRDDWLSALRDNGLQSGQPTAFLCEGLLPYLQPADQQRLLVTIGSAAPAGSVLVLDAPRRPFDTAALEIDSETFGVDMDNLFLDTGEFKAQQWLDDNGWATTSDSIGALLTSQGRSSDAVGDSFDIVVAQRR